MKFDLRLLFYYGLPQFPKSIRSERNIYSVDNLQVSIDCSRFTLIATILQISIHSSIIHLPKMTTRLSLLSVFLNVVNAMSQENDWRYTLRKWDNCFLFPTQALMYLLNTQYAIDKNATAQRMIEIVSIFKK